MGEWLGLVRRSLITLKALTYQPTGGIVAAPTTSLPEQLGGTRNWDYRYCWIRDATLTLLSLMHAGFYEEAQDWRLWLHRAVAGLPAQAQIMYGLPASGDCLNSYCPGFQDIRAQHLCELAMPPRINASSISTARCWMHTIRDGAADLLQRILRRTSSRSLGPPGSNLA